MAVSPARAAARPRYERQLPEQRRQELIDATIECLKRYGHEGLSMRAIASEAGVSLGLINHHFPNKDELIAAAYRHFNNELVGGLKAAVAEGTQASPRARMRAFFQASFSRPNLDPEALAVWVVFWGMYRHSPLIQGVHRESYQGYVQLLKDMLTELRERRRARGLPGGPAPGRDRPHRAPGRSVAGVVSGAGQLPSCRGDRAVRGLGRQSHPSRRWPCTGIKGNHPQI